MHYHIYNTLNQDTNSDSASDKSNGERLTLATKEIKEIIHKGGQNKMNHEKK